MRLSVKQKLIEAGVAAALAVAQGQAEEAEKESQK
jgi:hypothetical protein